MSDFHRVLHIQKKAEIFLGDFRKAQMIFSLQNSRLPLEEKFTFKSVVMAKIAFNMAHVNDVIVTSRVANPKNLKPQNAQVVKNIY